MVLSLKLLTKLKFRCIIIYQKEKVMIKKTDILKDILEKNSKAEEILLSFGMHCLYCPCAQAETLAEACEVHDLDVEIVLKALNKK